MINDEKFYYADVKYDFDKVGRKVSIDYDIKDSAKHKTNYKISDFDESKFFKYSLDSHVDRLGSYVIINMEKIKGILYHKSDYMDDLFLIYFDREKYEEDSENPRRHWQYDCGISGRKIKEFLDVYKNVNEELYSEIALLVEMMK